MLLCWHFKQLHCVHLCGLRAYHSTTDISQIDTVLPPKIKFIRLDHKPSLPQSLKHSSNMFQMLLPCISPDSSSNLEQLLYAKFEIRQNVPGVKSTISGECHQPPVSVTQPSLTDKQILEKLQSCEDWKHPCVQTNSATSYSHKNKVYKLLYTKKLHRNVLRSWKPLNFDDLYHTKEYIYFFCLVCGSLVTH